MDMVTRKQWVARGFKDPVAAYRQHAVNAGQRGIEFSLTFAEWWSLWEPHFHKRGSAFGQMVMCRNNDRGPYAIGNVRIDTVTANAQERDRVIKSNRLAQGRLPLLSERVYPIHGNDAGWINRRNRVFQEYVEQDDSIWEYDPA